jgi:hypothetical protein
MVIQRRYRLDGSTDSEEPGQFIGVGERPIAGGPLTTMRGRGGTCFRPVFTRQVLDWAADGGELSGLVVFSDGYGPVPSRPPREPVIWVLMGHGVRKPAEWGTVVNAADGAGGIGETPA